MRYSRTAILSMSGLALVLLAGYGGGWGQDAGGAGQMALDPGTFAVSSDAGTPEASPGASRTQEVLRGNQDTACNPDLANSETVPIITIKDTTETTNGKDTKVVVARPDSAIQPQGTGYFGWQIGSPDIVVAVVHFKKDHSPLPKGTFVIARHQAVGAGIRSDAACGYYEYEIRAYTKDGGVLEVDPGGRVY